MTQDTRIALFLMGELVAALRANGSDLFKRWLCGCMEDFGEAAVTSINLLTTLTWYEGGLKVLAFLAPLKNTVSDLSLEMGIILLILLNLDPYKI